MILSSRIPALLAACAVVLAPVAHAEVSAPTAIAGPVACASPAQAINEEGFVTIGGIEQWVTIKGDSCANPVLLMVHGGPGNPMSPYADNLYGAWKKNFTLVQWDQRGAGKTYGKNRPSEDTPLTFAQISDDGIEVAEYLTHHLGKPKVILMGGSWSSILAIQMIKTRPDLFYAYLGSAQMVAYKINQPETYAHLLTLARAAGDADSVKILEGLGAPPWTDPRSSGAMRRIDRKYEAMVTDPAPKAWWQPEAQYTTPEYEADYEAGEDYSYIQFVGLKGDGMYSGVDLPALGSHFDVPVFITQGAEDLLTSPVISRAYFDSIEAPQKAFVLVPRVGHDPNQPLVDAQFKMLTETIAPLAK